MKHYLLLVVAFGLSLLMSSSCGQKNYFAFDEVYSVKKFPITYELGNHEELDLGLVGVQGIKVLDNHILVSSGSDDGCLSIFDKKEMSQLFTFLKIGNGPGEILYKPYVSWMDFTHDGRYAYIYDFKGNLLEYDLSASIVSETSEWKIFAENLPVIGAARYFYVDDDCLLCRKSKADWNGYVRYLVDCNGERQPTMNVENLNSISSSEMNLLSTGFVINRKRNRIAELGSRLNVIHLYSYVDDFAVTLTIGKEMPELDEVESLPQGQMLKVYYDSKSFDDFFASLYLGTTIDELDSGKFADPRIHLFDWDGNPLAEIKIPVRTLFFDIDLTEKELYIIDYETEHLLKYDISDLYEQIN